MQRNWIGKSVGADVTFEVAGTDKSFEVFTTRPDTLFGATYAVLAPEHDLVDAITTPEQKEAVAEYRRKASLKSDLARTDLSKEKTGAFTGAYAINPINGRKMPIWVADYVLASYGHGAVMAVPAHDERDWEFAKVYGLEILPVLISMTVLLLFTQLSIASKNVKKRKLGKRKSLTACATGSLVVNVIGVNQFQLFIGKMAHQQRSQKMNFLLFYQ